MPPRQPSSTLFPYTTLFRSQCGHMGRGGKRQRPHAPQAGTARGELLVPADRKSTRLNSSHVKISYAVFCLKKKRIEVVYVNDVSGVVTGDIMRFWTCDAGYQ